MENQETKKTINTQAVGEEQLYSIQAKRSYNLHYRTVSYYCIDSRMEGLTDHHIR